jgi:hypothetical protein
MSRSEITHSKSKIIVSSDIFDSGAGRKNTKTYLWCIKFVIRDLGIFEIGQGGFNVPIEEHYLLQDVESDGPCLD